MRDAPLDNDDLSAAFRVGYDVSQNRLLVAVEIIDDSFVIPDQPSDDWTHADGCELYLDVTHGQGSGVQLARWGQ